MTKMIFKRGAIVLTIALLIAGCTFPQNVKAAANTRHEYWWASTEGGMQKVGPDAKENKISVKIKGNKLIVKGKPILTSKIESITDKKAKLLKYKKRTYKIMPNTKFYSLHWNYKTKVSKKEALRAIKKKQYEGFQVQCKGKKITKVYLLNHSY